ncbi:MAG: hypothetical protein CUN56_12445 [Phototrophicales bacterium]|nr:MAG: hypothetical protein CUN56_12445 [Phototrophicales bacterium]RMG73312.1 MAG: hypothetical protein D6711_11145 [Chloroflexota bacterium]
MRKYAILAFCLMILAAGGVLTVIDQAGGVGNLLPTLQQTADPAASTMAVEPWQAEQLFLLLGFIIFNMIGIAATIAFVMFVLHRNVRAVKGDAAISEDSAEAA